MKRFISLMMIVMTIGLFSCSSDKSNKTVRSNGSSETIKTEVNSELSSDIIEQVKAGLPAASLAQLLTDSQDISAFEDALNAKDGINNLDIDGDGIPDQLSVQDCSDDGGKKLAILGIYDDGNINFMEFKMVQNGESFTVECAPNEQYYGSNSYYRSDYRRGNGFVTGMMLGYLFSPRYVHYVPRYHRYGYYGNNVYVRSHRIVPMSRYRTRTVVTRTTTRASKRYTKSSTRPSSYKKSYNVKKKSSKVSTRAKKSRVANRSSLKNQTKSTKSLKTGTNSTKKAGFLKGGSKASPNTKAINSKAGNSLSQTSAKRSTANRTSLKDQKSSTKSLKTGTNSTKKSAFFGAKAKSSRSGSTSTKSSSTRRRSTTTSSSTRRRSSSSTTSKRSSSRKSSSSRRSSSSGRKRSDANFKTQIEYLK